MKLFRILPVILLAMLASPAFAQSFAGTGTTSVTVTVAAEAAISVDTSTTALTSSSLFGNFTGTTNLTYKVRTSKTNGTGSIVSQVTSDFSTGSGPSVASPPTAGDTLSYTCTSTAPGNACSGSQTSSTSTATPVAGFGANARSAKNGNSASVAWTLVNDPLYETGGYSATVTFTISGT